MVVQARPILRRGNSGIERRGGLYRTNHLISTGIRKTELRRFPCPRRTLHVTSRTRFHSDRRLPLHPYQIIRAFISLPYGPEQKTCRDFNGRPPARFYQHPTHPENIGRTFDTHQRKETGVGEVPENASRLASIERRHGPAEPALLTIGLIAMNAARFHGLV